MLQLGMPTLIETRTLSECAALCRNMGLDFIELNMNLPQYQLNVLDVPFLKETAERYGIFYTIHLDENLNVSDFNPYIADGYRRTVSETIQLAKRLDIPIINIHYRFKTRMSTITALSSTGNASNSVFGRRHSK